MIIRLIADDAIEAAIDAERLAAPALVRAPAKAVFYGDMDAPAVGT